VETRLREPRPAKVAVVDEVEQRLVAASAAILTEYRGISVKDLQQLRRALTAAGGDYKVYKNTLVRRAVQHAGLDVLEPMLTGPTAIAFVRDDVAAVAKVLRDFARANPAFVVKGGLIGSDLLDARRAAALADLPSREVLLAQFAGLLAAPMQRFAGLLQAIPQKFAYALKALIETRPVEPQVAAEVEGGAAWEAVGVSEEDAKADAPEPAADGDSEPATADVPGEPSAEGATETVADRAETTEQEVPETTEQEVPEPAEAETPEVAAGQVDEAVEVAEGDATDAAGTE